MTTKPIQVGIVLAQNVFDGKEAAFEYLVLQQNTLQRSIEFNLLPCLDIEPLNKLSMTGSLDRLTVEKSMSSVVDAYKWVSKSKSEDFKLRNESPSTILFLTTAVFSDNYFASSGDGWDIVALGNWDRYMSPPSIVEFFLNFSVRYSIDASCGDDLPKRHYETKGCMFDFAWRIPTARYGVLTGYLCSSCCTHIQDRTSTQFLDDVSLLLRKEWLGTITSPSDISMNTKKLGLDLFHVTGIKPTYRERIVMFLEDKLIDNVFKILIPVLVLALLIMLGMK